MISCLLNHGRIQIQQVKIFGFKVLYDELGPCAVSTSDFQYSPAEIKRHDTLKPVYFKMLHRQPDRAINE